MSEASPTTFVTPGGNIVIAHDESSQAFAVTPQQARDLANQLLAAVGASSEQEDTPRYAAELAEVTQAVRDNEGAPWYVIAAAAIRTLDAHRVAHASKQRNTDALLDERYDAKMTGANGDEEDL